MANYLYLGYNNGVINCSFPSILENNNIAPTYKKDSRVEEKITALLVFSLRKYLRRLYILK